MNHDTDIVGVELPLADTHLSQQTEFGFIESISLNENPQPNIVADHTLVVSADQTTVTMKMTTDQSHGADAVSSSGAQVIALGDHLPAVLVDVELLQELASIPDRLGFKIGDVADLLGIKQYILRYWEQEFDLLRPKKASNNQRLYTKRDVENAFLIRKLLYRDKFSIEGARQAIRDVKFAVKKEKDYSTALVKIDENHSQLAADARDLVKRIRQLKEIFI